jgi:CheY-like chemotaxis protein
VLLASRSFYESFKVMPKETVGNLIYDLGNRQWDIPSKLKVIAVTSFAIKGDREKALEARFDEYVTKSIDTRKFIAPVKKIV